MSFFMLSLKISGIFTLVADRFGEYWKTYDVLLSILGLKCHDGSPTFKQYIVRGNEWGTV